jgi:hypothetical protein
MAGASLREGRPVPVPPGPWTAELADDPNNKHELPQCSRRRAVSMRKLNDTFCAPDEPGSRRTRQIRVIRVVIRGSLQFQLSVPLAGRSQAAKPRRRLSIADWSARHDS